MRQKTINATRERPGMAEKMREASRAPKPSLRERHHRERVAEQVKAWRLANPEKAAEGDRRLDDVRSFPKSTKSKMEDGAAEFFAPCRRNVDIVLGGRRFELDIYIEPALVIEVDGPHHFSDYGNVRRFVEVRARDIELERIAASLDLCLIRIGTDCFTGSGHLFPEVVEPLTQLKNNPIPGIHRFGDAWERNGPPKWE